MEVWENEKSIAACMGMNSSLLIPSLQNSGPLASQNIMLSHDTSHVLTFHWKINYLLTAVSPWIVAIILTVCEVYSISQKSNEILNGDWEQKKQHNSLFFRKASRYFWAPDSQLSKKSPLNENPHCD